MKNIFTLIAIMFVSFSSSAQDTKTEQKQKEAFVVVEQMPEYSTGLDGMYQFISQHIQYPADAKKEGITGRVMISFIVEADGTLSNFKVVKGVDGAPSLGEEAIRVLKLMPNWKPGKHNGKPVAVVYNLPVNFTIED